jgi:hypothetical protein
MTMRFKLNKTINGGTVLNRVGDMTMDQTQVNTLWDQGFRPYEIYVYNQTPTDYFGETVGAGIVAGWDIKHVFSTRELLKSYPYFDAVIGSSDMSVCEEIWKG